MYIIPNLLLLHFGENVMKIRTNIAKLQMHVSFVGKRELVALLSLCSWCFMIVVWLFLAMPWVCLQFVIVLFPTHTHYFYNLETRSDTLKVKNFGFFFYRV